MATIPSNQNFPTNKQIPDHAILDILGKQTYLGNEFIYSVPSNQIVSGSETALLYHINPVGNSKSLFHSIRKLTCITLTNTVLFRFYSNPTVSSNGTLQTPTNLRPANANLTTGNLYLSPTASANGTFLGTLASSAFVPDVSNVLLILDPGQSILVTAQASAASTAIATELGWYEL